MTIKVFADAAEAAQQAAKIIAASVRPAVATRGQFVLAVSGGRTPWQMLRAFASEDVSWKRLHFVQVDERAAPFGHPDRNLTHLSDCLLSNCSVPPEQICPMPVELSDLESAAAEYGATLKAIANAPPMLDLVQLGLGVDGHTASLVPGDPALDVTDADVAATRLYQGRRRMTLTYPILNRSRCIVWLVTGADKHQSLVRLCNGDPSIPAGGVRQDNALLIADRAAADGI